MAIEKGEPWGGAEPVPTDTPIAADDADAARLFVTGHRLIALAGGDLCRSLGGRGDVAERLGGSATVCTVDVGVVELDEHVHHFVAHVLARGRFWRGESLAVMNAEYLGEWRLGPRAHPGDGLLDITEGSMPWRQLLAGRARARTGDHLPHPALRTHRTSHLRHTFSSARLVTVDGVALGSCHDLAVSVIPAALRVAV